MTFFSEKFLQRIQYEEKDTISFEDLPTVMSQFAKHIPFENIEVMLNIDREMKAEQLYEKIIKQNRGGLCYELNPLFYYFLKNYGFQVYMISATVLGSRNPLQGTHVAIVLEDAGEKYIVDVGFGANLPLQPVPLNGELMTSQTGSYRVVQKKYTTDKYYFEKYVNGDLQIRYLFTLEPIDEKYLNQVKHVITKDERSSFNKSLLITKLTKDGHQTLTDDSFTTVVNGKRKKQVVHREKVKHLAVTHFHMEEPLMKEVLKR